MSLHMSLIMSVHMSVLCAHVQTSVATHVYAYVFTDVYAMLMLLWLMQTCNAVDNYADHSGGAFHARHLAD